MGWHETPYKYGRCLFSFFSIYQSNIKNGKLNIFNVGHNNNNIKIINIAKIIAKLTNVKIHYNFDKKA